MKIALAFISTLLAIVLVLAYGLVKETPGALDTSFNINDKGFGKGDGADNDVEVILIQPDGKLIIAGQFLYYNEVRVNQIARINTDGSIDTTFQSGSGFFSRSYTSNISAMALQNDGKIIVAGQFSYYNEQPAKRLARLNPDGSLDTTFDSSKNGKIAFSINCIAIQDDGKVLYGTEKISNNESAAYSIMRLEQDGAVDESFTNNIQENVLSLALQDDGSILVGGDFPNGLVHIDSKGQIDPGFNIENENFGAVAAIAVDKDKKIILGSQKGLYRIHPNGLTDLDFKRPIESKIKDIDIQPNGDIVFIGNFSGDIERLKSDGSKDQFFNVGDQIHGHATRLHDLAHHNESLYLATSRTNFDKYAVTGIIKLKNDYSFDTDFNRGSGVNGKINSITIQPENKVILAGTINTVNGEIRKNISRMNENGELDFSFDAGFVSYGEINFITQQKDGKLLLGGLFTPSKDKENKSCFIRLEKNGSVDTSFIFNQEICPVKTAVTQDNGDIFISTNSLPLIKIDGNGNVKKDFITTNKGSGDIENIAIQPDGKIIIAGDFTRYGERNFSKIARLNPDGSVDMTFNPGKGPNQKITAIAIQSDGKILASGPFSSWGGNKKHHAIIRMNPDGTLDTEFISSIEHAWGGQIHIQEDGKILITGRLAVMIETPIAGTDRTRKSAKARGSVIRLNQDGSLDKSFQTGKGLDGIVDDVWASAIADDGDLIIGGQFTSYDAQGRNRIAKIHTGQYRWQWNKKPNNIPIHKILLPMAMEHLEKLSNTTPNSPEQAPPIGTTTP